MKQTNRKGTDQRYTEATEKKQGNTHVPFSCPSETVSAPVLNTQVVSADHEGNGIFYSTSYWRIT